MDRSIAYTQEQGRSTDFLFAQRASMIGLGQLAQAMLGSRTLVFGLGVTPTTPASLSVDVAAGQIYSVQPVDATAYGVLAADTTDQIVKQGIALQAQTLALTAPSTAGYSINYLIEATYEDQDTNPAVLPYFNSANPSQPLSGQNNSGAAQATQRQGVLVLTLKAGAAAPTGSQTTPAPDSGYVGVAVVTVANGQTQITGANITQLVGGALFANLLQAMQGATAITAPDTGTVNALAITLSPAPAALTPGMMVAVDNILASNTGASTLNVNGLGALPIQSAGGVALQGGELAASYGALLRLNHASTAWTLLQTTGGALPVKGASKTEHSLNLGQFPASLTGAGYLKVPLSNGGVLQSIILQWGSGNASSSGASVAYPIAFPNSVFAVFATAIQGSPVQQFVDVSNQTLTSATYTSNSGTPPFFFFAIGN